MSRPIARHADKSDCYTPNCSRRHVPVVSPRESFITSGIRENQEAAKKAAFQQEWRERAAGWKDMGFQYPVSVRKYENWVRYKLAADAELSHLSENERHAIRFFSSNNYRWLNAHLYGQVSLPEATGEVRAVKDYRVDSMSTQEIEQAPTQTLANEVTGLLDTALAKRQDKQRMLYRGMSRSALGKITGKYMSDDEFAEHVKSTYQPGAEISTSGYLSASPSAKVGMDYANSTTVGTGLAKEGVFFEMLTSAGVNISGHSMYAREAETLLPRDIRWRVVAVHPSKSVRTQEIPNVNRGYEIRPQSHKVTLIQLIEVV